MAKNLDSCLEDLCSGKTSLQVTIKANYKGKYLSTFHKKQIKKNSIYFRRIQNIQKYLKYTAFMLE